MNITEVQTKLTELGLLDPPADGVWGGVSSWALAQVMGGPVQTESVTSKAVEDKLLAARPLPLVPGDDLAGLAVKATLAHGGWICRHPKCFNLIYMEGTNLDGNGNGDPPNHFAALRTLIVVGADGIPHYAPVPGGGIAKWIATTEPSRYWTENPMNDLGAARLILGQQKGWTMGEYHDVAALIEAANLKVQRDPDATYKRYGPVYTGQFGIHHHVDYGYPINDEGRSSAGCCVGWNTDQHETFMSMEATDPRYRANHGYKFMSSIVTHADLLAVKGATLMLPASPDAVSRRCNNIWMTFFADSDDPEDSAYTGDPIDPNSVGFSVSYRFPHPRPWVRCWNRDTGKKVEGPLVDVGPGLTNDPWWIDPNGQPGAHNGAGLDATPAVWRQLGLDLDLGKVRVDFELFRAPDHASWKPQG